MALTPGIDTFASLSEANAYHEGRPSAETWAGYDDQKREACLRAAYDRITAACTLSFDPATEPTPQMVKNAQCELALQVSKLEEVDEISGSEVTEMKAGPGVLKFIPSTAPTDGVTNLIKSWLARAGCACDWGGTGSSGLGSSERPAIHSDYAVAMDETLRDKIRTALRKKMAIVPQERRRAHPVPLTSSLQSRRLQASNTALSRMRRSLTACCMRLIRNLLTSKSISKQTR